MIFDAILGFLIDVMSAVVDLLPDGDPLGLDSASGLWIGYAQLNTFLPLTELLAMLAAYLTVVGAIYAYLVLRAIRNWLPFI